jgi:hypothetical protein
MLVRLTPAASIHCLQAYLMICKNPDGATLFMLQLHCFLLRIFRLSSKLNTLTPPASINCLQAYLMICKNPDGAMLFTIPPQLMSLSIRNTIQTDFYCFHSLLAGLPDDLQEP